MSKIVTFLTTDPCLHWRYFYTIALELIARGYKPVMLLNETFDTYGDVFEFSKVVASLLLPDPFTVLNPIAHVQMQDHDEYHRNIIKVAKSKGTRTFSIQHGGTDYMEGNEHLYGLFDTICDYVCVWDEDFAAQYKENMTGDGEIIITGNSRHDMLPMKADTGINNIFITTKPLTSTDGDVNFPIAPEIVFDRFLDIVRAYPDKRFIVKQHPSPYDPTEYWVEIIDKYEDKNNCELNNIFFVERDFDIMDFLIQQQIDLLCHFSTTCANDCAASGVPMIDLRLHENPIDEFKSILDGNRPVNNDKYFKYVKTDRKGAERIVDFIIGDAEND